MLAKKIILEFPIFKNKIETYQTRVRHSSIPVTEISNQFASYLCAREMYLCYIEQIYSPPYYEGTIHIDSDKEKNLGKLNVIIGGGESKMCWYETVDTYAGQYNSTRVNTPSRIYNTSYMNKVYSIELADCSAICQVGKPHNVINNSKDRWSFGFVFKQIENDQRSTFENLYKNM